MAKTSDYYETYLYPELVDRRERLQTAARTLPADPGLSRLLGEVDEALGRIAAGTYGFCETCHDPIEQDRLTSDPLLRFCLDHLTSEQQRDLEEDLQTAARVQRALLPKPRLELEGWEIAFHYEPAGLVSGDCCDVFSPGDRKDELVFVFGDVSGKGVSAAMLMSNLHATFRSLAAASLPIASLVEQANRIFRSMALSRYFATLVSGRVLASGELEICNAGHCPPFLLNKGNWTTLPPTGLPVGTFYSYHYTSRKVQLDCGDTLVLYTDGLSEARNADGDEYGSERLELVLQGLHGARPAEIISACLADLRKHLARQPKGDDLSLLVLRHSEAPQA